MRLARFAWRNAKRPASLGPRGAKVASLLVDLDLSNGACECGVSRVTNFSQGVETTITTTVIITPVATDGINTCRPRCH